MTTGKMTTGKMTIGKMTTGKMTTGKRNVYRRICPLKGTFLRNLNWEHENYFTINTMRLINVMAYNCLRIIAQKGQQGASPVG